MTKITSESNPVPAKKLPCPNCGESVVYSVENAYRPFCSDRCQKSDLYGWATEEFKIPVKEEPQD